MPAAPHELFIVLDQFAVRHRELAETLAAVARAGEAGPRVIGSDAYYRAETELALLALRFDRDSMSEPNLAWVRAVAEHARLLIVDPDRLETDDRVSFYDRYLPRYGVRVADQDGPEAALGELARRLGLPDAPALSTRRDDRPPSGAMPAPPPMPEPPHRPVPPPADVAGLGAYAVSRPPASRRRDEAPPAAGSPPPRRVEGGWGERAVVSTALPSAPPSELRGVRSSAGVAPLERGRAARTTERNESDRGESSAGRYQMGRTGAREKLGVTANVRHPAAARRHLTPTPEPIAPTPSPLPRPRGKQPRRADGSVLSKEPTSGEAAVSRARPTGGQLPGAELRHAGRGSSPPPPIVGHDPEAPAIQARYLRGDTWVPARLRSINLRSARLAAVAPPRLGDVVDLAVELGGHGPIIRGEVTQTVDALHAGDGSTGFTLGFLPLDGERQAQLVALLTQARDAGIALRPPPPRCDVRFAVHWPARLLTPYGEVESAALDVSRSGMFLATDDELEGDLRFRIPLDVGDIVVAGHATIARQVTDAMASSRGLTRGYGVQITDLGHEVAARWDGFLERVRQRSARRLLIAARPQRAEALTRGLAGAGYVVQAAVDIQALLEQTERDPSPPDAALIDVGLADADPATQRLRRLFNQRHVPCVTVGDEAPERARAVVDHLLHIA